MRHSKLAGALVLSALVLPILASESEAHGRPRFYRYYDPYRFYYPYYPWFGFYYGGFHPFVYPAYYRPYVSDLSLLRLEVKPRETEVYVDGYLAGVVDEFDGFFQRLRLAPGPHEITLYLEGHRTIREKLHLVPGQSYKIRRVMEPVDAAEPEEPRPEPPIGSTSVAPATMPVPAPAGGFGTLEIRTEPPGAEVVIDGDSWPSGDPLDPLVLHLRVGAHRVEIRRSGKDPFVTDVTVLAGKTTSLNVKLED